MTIEWQNKVALVTGANRGIGLALVEALIARGAKRVYVSGRDALAIKATVETLVSDTTELIPITLNVTSAADITRVQAQIGALDLLINNAGIALASGFIQDTSDSVAQQEMATHYFGPLKLTHALLSSLRRSPAAAIVNISSIAGIANMPVLGPYSAAKAALHSLTQGLRAELQREGIFVQGVYPGPVATRLSEGYDAPKPQPAEVAAIILESLEQKIEDVFPDALSQHWYQTFKTEPKQLEREYAAWLG
jgi:NAD(P)-dependent dehydrogenase (short-subunit alcohol dehydrogenase family)